MTINKVPSYIQSVRIPSSLVLKMDEIIDETKRYNHRSDFVLYAFRRMINAQYVPQVWKHFYAQYSGDLIQISVRMPLGYRVDTTRAERQDLLRAGIISLVEEEKRRSRHE